MKFVKLLYLNPLNAELNPICHLLTLLGGATIVVVSRLRVKENNRAKTLLKFHNVLDKFAKLRKASISFVIYVNLSVRLCAWN